jgi:hypothetical protein
MVHTDMIPRFRDSTQAKLLKEAQLFRRACGFGSASEMADQVILFSFLPQVLVFEFSSGSSCFVVALLARCGRERGVG